MFGTLLLFSAAMYPPAQDLCPTLITSSVPDGRGKASYYANLSGGDPKVTPTFN
jgi:hypothetical protein